MWLPPSSPLLKITSIACASLHFIIPGMPSPWLYWPPVITSDTRQTEEENEQLCILGTSVACTSSSWRPVARTRTTSGVIWCVLWHLLLEKVNQSSEKITRLTQKCNLRRDTKVSFSNFRGSHSLFLSWVAYTHHWTTRVCGFEILHQYWRITAR